MKQSRTQIEINGRKYPFKCPYREKCERKRVEFSKIAVAFITLFCMGGIAANYILAFLNAQNINSEVTITLVGTILGTVLGYFFKSFGEKNSRNIYNVNEQANDENNLD